MSTNITDVHVHVHVHRRKFTVHAGINIRSSGHTPLDWFVVSGVRGPVSHDQSHCPRRSLRHAPHSPLGEGHTPPDQHGPPTRSHPHSSTPTRLEGR